MSDAPEVAALLMRHRGAIYAHLLAAVRNPHDAEDLLQEVSMAASRSADAFEAGSNFLAWIREIARRRILEYARERGRDSVVRPLENLEMAAATLDVEPEDRRRDALSKCLEEMPPTSRRILDLRYQENLDVPKIAQAVGRTVQATYAILKRARIVLRDCAERALGVAP
jgi:RNA polymerase sigma-70 factor (ECF subfamily)